MSEQPLGEFDLITRYFDRGAPRRARLGIGDDCALLAPLPAGAVLAVTSDMLVAGRHFLPESDPEGVGHKTLAVNLSDLAAMGARPVAFTLSMSLPQIDTAWLEKFTRGLFAIADRHDCELIGGDTTRGPLNLCVTAFGEVPSGVALRRDLAQPGDDVWVSGSVGGAAYALSRLLGPTPPATGDLSVRRLERPEPRVALGIALRHLARAAIDVSDGLLGDLAHLCERSRVAARIDWSRVPIAMQISGLDEGVQQRFALAGGDDYELLFTAPAENRTGIQALSSSLQLALTRIGEILPGSGVQLVDGRGMPIPVSAQSFDHFA